MRWQLLALIALCLVLTGCASDSVSPTPQPIVPTQKIQCQPLNDPVCGSNGVSYTNECYAKQSKVAVACKGSCPCHVESTSSSCPKEYKPVCGHNGITYANSCRAHRANVAIVSFGPCNKDPDCTGNYNPVCGQNGKTYYSSCEAKKDRMEILHAGKCTTESVYYIESDDNFFYDEDDSKLIQEYEAKKHSQLPWYEDYYD